MKTVVAQIDGTVLFFDDRSLSQAREDRVEFLREITTQHISQACPQSTQQNAALGIYSPERCEAIKNYIAACRNEYLRCKALILAATSNDEADSVQFVAPPVPENL